MIMNLVTYDPFRELRGLQDEINRAFSSSFNRSGDNELMRGAWSPSVDIYENKDQIVLEAELPGINPDDVDISIENNVLTVHGERKFEKKDEQDNDVIRKYSGRYELAGTWGLRPGVELILLVRRDLADTGSQELYRIEQDTR